MTTPIVPPPLPAQPAAPATSTLAIWSLVLGILSFCGGCVTGVPAIILAILALTKINKSPAVFKGQGLAIAGLVTGIIGGLFGTGILAGRLVPAISTARARTYDLVCANNVRQITTASLMYAADHHGVMPQSLDQLDKYLNAGATDKTQNVLVCPIAEDKTKPSYEIVAPGQKLADTADPSKTIFIREIEPRHRGGRVVGYMDGHVERVRDR